MSFEDQRIMITGGTGSLGRALVHRLLTGERGRPKKITVFSRDEEKQHAMRMEYRQQRAATDEIIYRNAKDLLVFIIGDVRDYSSVLRAVRDADVIFNAAALKQVPTCEYFPFEAVRTNVIGPYNLVRAVTDGDNAVKLAVGISTDKACKPVNVMGMSKALQERILIEANLACPDTRFICVRYGNVVGSRGSVIPLFQEQIRQGGPVTITLREMTRFMIDIDRAVDTVFDAARSARPGEIYVPKLSSARIIDMADLLIGSRDIPIKYIGIRPGEKIHEILISEEECFRTVGSDGYYVIHPVLPELRPASTEGPTLKGEYSSRDHLMGKDELRSYLERNGFAVGQ